MGYTKKDAKHVCPNCTARFYTAMALANHRTRPDLCAKFALSHPERQQPRVQAAS